MSNFAFLSPLVPGLAALGQQAEGHYLDDAESCMFKLRKFVEVLTREVARRWEEPGPEGEALLDRIQRIRHGLPDRVVDLLHELRRQGNRAVHESHFSQAEAAAQLRNARGLAAWFFGEFGGDPDARLPAFRLPALPDPRADARARRALARPEPAAAPSAAAAALPSRSGPEVGIYASLHDAFRAIPEADQQRLAGTIQRFRQDPGAPEFRLQPFAGSADDKLRWLRLDADYALVVVQPPRGEVLLCAWIGRHPEVYAWARTRRVEVHPVLGSLQVYDVAEAQAATVPAHGGGLFGALSDADLERCGLPRLLLPSVRALAGEADLGALAPHLPAEAADALYLLAAGCSLEEILAEAARPPRAEEPVDTEDFSVALHHPDSRRRFALLEPGASLEEMLQAPLEAWRVYLHPDQHRLVRRRASGPVRVLGGAGTGKTVALLHRALHLATEVFDQPTDRLLVTTYTRTLALELHRTLRRMFQDAGADFSRVTVLNLHRQALGYLRAHTAAEVRVISPEQQEAAWRRALAGEKLGLPAAFYREEWDSIVQAQGISERAGYLRARRVGRGTALTHAQRRAAWEVLGGYQAQLREGGWLEWPDVVRRARRQIEADGPPFQAVLADEIQDFGEEDLRLLRALAAPGPDDLFMVGDTFQRIYRSGVPMSRCGIEIRGRARRLKVNYRTTEQIRGWAVAVLHGTSVDDPDDPGQDPLQGYHSLRPGQPPARHLFPDEATEAAFLARQIRGWLAEGAPAESICVSARTRAQVERYRGHLQAAGLPAVLLSEDEDSAAPGVRLSTMHRMKGLEFPRVVLAGVQAGSVPLRRAGGAAVDQASAEDAERRERCLVYVAATRARDELLVTGSGSPSPWFA